MTPRGRAKLGSSMSVKSRPCLWLYRNQLRLAVCSQHGAVGQDTGNEQAGRMGCIDAALEVCFGKGNCAGHGQNVAGHADAPWWETLVIGRARDLAQAGADLSTILDGGISPK